MGLQYTSHYITKRKIHRKVHREGGNAIRLVNKLVVYRPEGDEGHPRSGNLSSGPHIHGYFKKCIVLKRPEKLAIHQKSRLFNGTKDVVPSNT